MAGSPQALPAGHAEVGTRAFYSRWYRRLGAVAAVTLGIILVAAYVAPLPRQNWYGTPLAGSATTATVATDAGGSAHVVYSSGGAEQPLVYATNEGGAWDSVTLDNRSSCCASLALDSAGGVRVAYAGWNGTWPPMALEYAAWDGHTATRVTLATNSFIFSPSIALDSRDRVHIAFLQHHGEDPNWSVSYATNADGPWTVAVVANYSSGSVFSTRLALDGEDRPYVAVGLSPAAGSVGVFVRAGNGWAFTGVDTSADWVTSVSLAVDSAGHAFVVFPYLADLNATTVLRYATNVSGQWVGTDIGPADGDFSGLALDSAGHAHIVFLDPGCGLTYATDASGAWVLERVTTDASSSCEDNSFGIAAAAGGTIHIVAIESGGMHPLDDYTNVAPPFTLGVYGGRLVASLPYWALAVLAAGAAVPIFAHSYRAVQARRDRKAQGRAKYLALLERRWR